MWDQGQLDVADEIFHPDFTSHALPPGQTKVGPEGAKKAVAEIRAGLPDMRLTVDDMLAEGDRVLTRWTAVGTHTGPLAHFVEQIYGRDVSTDPGPGGGPIPPTGKTAVVRGINLNRVEDGKITDLWDVYDLMGMLQQLGVIPAGPPGGGGPPPRG
jgi:predicted ester cyclase